MPSLWTGRHQAVRHTYFVELLGFYFILTQMLFLGLCVCKEQTKNNGTQVVAYKQSNTTGVELTVSAHIVLVLDTGSSIPSIFFCFVFLLLLFVLFFFKQQFL